MATASSTVPVRRSARSPMPYTPYILNPSALPYGLWIDIPFRKRGSTEIRSEAKGRGARFCPAAKGKNKWWMPKNKLSEDTVNWLNSHEMIRGERKAPVFNPTAMTVADINLAYPFRVFLAVPFEDKDIVKGMGAFWSADDKRWFFNATNLTQNRFDEMLKRQWLFSFHGVLKNDPTNTATGVYFFKEDFGDSDASDPAVVPFKPFVPQVWTFAKDGTDATMSTTADGRIVLVCDYLGVNAIHTKDEARALWNGLISDGWILK